LEPLEIVAESAEWALSAGSEAERRENKSIVLAEVCKTGEKWHVDAGSSQT
jgi:hypothetical protein